MAPKECVGIILAAGESTRMKSDTPKVLHPLLGRPMLEYVIRAVSGSGIRRIVIVIGFKKEMLLEMFKGYGVEFVNQKERLGTAHAVLQALPSLEGFEGDCLITCGDTPLITERTLTGVYQQHLNERADLTLLTAHLEDPFGYGRILRDKKGNVAEIVEEKDANQDQKGIREVNTGVYCFRKGVLFDLLGKVGRENKQGEYYLTDCISLARQSGMRISNHLLQDPAEMYGVNSRAELARVTAVIRRKKLESLMLNGVTIMDPAATYIDYDVCIGRDTTVYPYVVIEGKSVIGSGCTIFPFTFIRDIYVGDGDAVGKAPLRPFDRSV